MDAMLVRDCCVVLLLVAACLLTHVDATRRRGNEADDSSRGRRRGRDRQQDAPAQNPRRRHVNPNIVVVITDDQDKELGSLNFMPKLNKLLGSTGAVFSNAFVTTPMCCPSRSSILTGMYVHNHNVYTNNQNCSSMQWRQTHETRNFGTYLTNAGYRTGYFGKYLNEYNGDYIPPGWTEWMGLVKNTRFYNYTVNFNGNKIRHGDNYYDDYFTDRITNDSVTFLKKSKELFPNRPVAMVLSMPAPHGPEDAAPQYQHLFTNITTHRTPSWNAAPNPDKQWLLQHIGKMEPIHIAFTDMLHRKRLQTLQSVDDAVEKVIGELRDLGELDNTYVMFTSDHGYHLGQYGLLKGKSMAYDFDIRVPFYLRGPNIPSNIQVPNIVLNVDIAPTLLDMAGVEVPEHMDGRSILKLFEGANEPGGVVSGVLKRKKAWRDVFLVERGKITNKKLIIRDRLEEQRNINQLMITKEQRLEQECEKPEYQPPCTPNQRWVCDRGSGKLRITKCRHQGQSSETAECECPEPTLPTSPPQPTTPTTPTTPTRRRQRKHLRSILNRPDEVRQRSRRQRDVSPAESQTEDETEDNTEMPVEGNTGRRRTRRRKKSRRKHRTRNHHEPHNPAHNHTRTASTTNITNPLTSSTRATTTPTAARVTPMTTPTTATATTTPTTTPTSTPSTTEDTLPSGWPAYDPDYPMEFIAPDTYHVVPESSSTSGPVTNTGSSPMSCRVLSNNTVACEDGDYRGTEFWEAQKQSLDTMISEFRAKLHELRGIRKVLRKTRPGTDQTEADGQIEEMDEEELSSDLSRDTSGGLESIDDIDGDDVEEIGGTTDGPPVTRSVPTEQTPKRVPVDDWAVVRRDDEQADRRQALWDEERSIEELFEEAASEEPSHCQCEMLQDPSVAPPPPPPTQSSRRERRRQERQEQRMEKMQGREQRRQQRRRGRKGAGETDEEEEEEYNVAHDCNSASMKCFTHDNEHWRTAPYWTLGPFCFCPNSNNNTFWCLRAINETHDFLYCEFITGFISYYDMTRDPYQLRNAVHDLSYNLLHQLHDQLERMKGCSGGRECNLRSRRQDGTMTTEEGSGEVDGSGEVKGEEDDHLLTSQGESSGEVQCEAPDPFKISTLALTNVFRLDTPCSVYQQP